MAGSGGTKAGSSPVVRHASGQQGLRRVEENLQPGNAASIARVRACGFSRAGCSPKYLEIGGRWRDHERRAWVRGAPRGLRNHRGAGGGEPGEGADAAGREPAGPDARPEPAV